MTTVKHLKATTNMGINLLNVTRKTISGGKELIECDAKNGDGVFKRATIWKLDKEGKIFPGWDTISDGSIIEGNLWNKPGTDNWTIYPPKPKAGGFGGGMGAGLVKAKTEAIKEAQSNKEHAINKAQDRNEVMYAKKSAAEIIAHHPAYKELNDLNLPKIWQDLTRTILNYNPNSTLNALQKDDLTEARTVGRTQVEYPETDINPDDVPF